MQVGRLMEWESEPDLVEMDGPDLGRGLVVPTAGA
jgi:hypothetical protein